VTDIDICKTIAVDTWAEVYRDCRFQRGRDSLIKSSTPVVLNKRILDCLGEKDVKTEIGCESCVSAVSFVGPKDRKFLIDRFIVVFSFCLEDGEGNLKDVNIKYGIGPEYDLYYISTRTEVLK